MTSRSGSPPPSLPHLAYLEALAQCTENSARWNSVTAGYAVLQLFDAWAESDCGGIAPSALEFRRVRRRITAIPESEPIRRCLVHLVDAVERSAPDAEQRALRGLEVGRLLSAYGKLLQYEASWSLARDVYETLVSYARCIDDEERLLDSMLMVGFSLRMLAEFDEARDAYGRLRDVAAMLESEQYLLLSELGFAKIAIERGNLPAAAGMLDQIITEAREEVHSGIRAKALMDRARVANQLGDLASAAILGYQALELTTDSAGRDRILVNLGMTLTHLGMVSEARDAYLVVNATAQDATMRWLAEINLMELAYLEAREIAFEQHRRRVADVDLPPYLRAVFQETLAHGCRVFGREAAATAAFEEMRVIGERFGLNEFIIRADAALEDVMNARPELTLPAAGRTEQQPADVLAVANAITELRVRVGVRA